MARLRMMSGWLALVGMAAPAWAQTPPTPTPTPPTPPASAPNQPAKPAKPADRPSDPPKVAPTPSGEGKPIADPAQDESLKDASLNTVADGQQGKPATPPTVAPTRPTPKPIAPTNAKGAPVLPAPTPGVIPGVPRDDPSMSARRFYPEGTFLSRRGGKLIKATTGDVVFVPARDAKGRGEAPMILLPSQTLARLEAAPGVFSETTTVVLSGEVYVYYDRQYLLPSIYTVDRQAADIIAPPAGPATPTGAPSTPAPRPTTTPAPAGGKEGLKSADATDPAVADIIRELETKRGSAKAPDVTPNQQAKPAQPGPEGTTPPTPPTPSPTGAPAASPTTNPAPEADAKPKTTGSVTTEGTVLFNRRARLVRVANGPLMAAFDGDTKSPSSGPMVLLRCRMSQRLDELAASRGDDLSLQVSGRVFVYAGRNYLLPTLAQVVPTGDVRSLQ